MAAMRRVATLFPRSELPARGPLTMLARPIFTDLLRNNMRTKHTAILILAAASLFGCSTIAEKTNMLTDEKILSSTSGSLGYSTNDLTIMDRRVDGTNTYVNLKAKDKKEFTCVINGGNALTMGLTNPPMCGRKGSQINTNPFQK